MDISVKKEIKKIRESENCKESKGYLHSVPDFLEKSGILYGYTDLAHLSLFKEYYDGRPDFSISPFEENPEDKTEVFKDKGMTGIISMAFPYLHEDKVENDGSKEKSNFLNIETGSGKLLKGSFSKYTRGIFSKYTRGIFSKYTRGTDYHRVIRELTEPLLEIIKESGYRAELYTDSNELPERALAMLSGTGRRGRNGLIYTKEYGSYVFLAEILTDMPLDSKKPSGDMAELHSMCRNCSECIKACPGNVLGGSYLRVQRCISYLTQEKNIKPHEASLFKGRLFGCDTCQDVCPINRGVKKGLKEFFPFPHMDNPDINELSVLTNSKFNEKYKKTSAGWRGKNILRRNAMILQADLGILNESEVPDEGFLALDIRSYLSYLKLTGK